MSTHRFSCQETLDNSVEHVFVCKLQLNISHSERVFIFISNLILYTPRDLNFLYLNCLTGWNIKSLSLWTFISSVWRIVRTTLMFDRISRTQFRADQHDECSYTTFHLQKIQKVKNRGGFIFTKGQLEELTDLLTSRTDISAVFINVDVLKINQVAMLQGAWKMPVFDRYFLCTNHIVVDVKQETSCYFSQEKLHLYVIYIYTCCTFVSLFIRWIHNIKCFLVLVLYVHYR